MTHCRLSSQRYPLLLVSIIQGVAEAWPALTKWTDEYLDQAFHGKEVVVSNAKIPMPEFRRYVREHRDESPLYLFDKTFVETAPELGDDFEV